MALIAHQAKSPLTNWSGLLPLGLFALIGPSVIGLCVSARV